MKVSKGWTQSKKRAKEKERGIDIKRGCRELEGVKRDRKHNTLSSTPPKNRMVFKKTIEREREVKNHLF